jgi:hypothetical protein
MELETIRGNQARGTVNFWLLEYGRGTRTLKKRGKLCICNSANLLQHIGQGVVAC